VLAQATVCAADASSVNVVVSSVNLAFLSLGRFVFLPYQKASLKRAGQPTQNGVTHQAAGDIRAVEAEGVLRTGDPAGFTLIGACLGSVPA